MGWSIQQVARAAGTTTRTLRYYGEVGLLAPSRIGRNGYRFYDEDALVRLQRILLLRELGLGIPEITRVLAGERDPVSALGLHLQFLESEKNRLVRQIASVETTLRKLKGGEQLKPTEVFDGFDHTQYREEVIERWGQDAYDHADRWWRSLSEQDKQQHQLTQTQVARDFAEAVRAGKAPGSDDVQAITRRHVQWLSLAVTPSKGYLAGLGDCTWPIRGSRPTTTSTAPEPRRSSATRWRSTSSGTTADTQPGGGRSCRSGHRAPDQ